MAIMLIYGINVLIAYLISVNFVTFVVYGFDKSVSMSPESRSFKLRVPEIVMQSLSLAGGSPAALAGQKLFRHKTIKSSFQFIYWSIVILQIALLVYFLS